MSNGRLKRDLEPRVVRFTPLMAAALLASAVVVAQDNPHYVNARTYLRTAQALIRVPVQSNVQLTLKPADDELDAAVREIDRAGVVNRRSMVDHPAINDRMDDADRFRSIADLLRAARNEIQQGADDAHDKWRSEVLTHIRAAFESVHKAAIAAKLDREIGDY